MRGEVPRVQVVNITAPQLIKQWKKFLSQVKNQTSLIRSRNGKLSSKSREFSGIEKSCMSPVRRNVGGILETEQWNCWSYAAAKRRLPLVYCYVQGGYDAVVVSSEDIPMCLCYFWPFPVPLMPLSSRNAVLRHAQGWLTLVKWLLLSGKMFVRLSLLFIPSPDVTQLVLLLVKANSSP